MGNKHPSTSPGKRASDPTVRSFSWQQDGARVDVHPDPNFYDAQAQFARYDPRQLHQEQRARSYSASNGDASRGGGGGGGLAHLASAEAQLPSSPAASPAKRSPPDTNDSGYFTGFDSDPKSRSKLRGSRLSLNEAMFNDQIHCFPGAPYPPEMAVPPHFAPYGMPHYPPPFMPPPFDPTAFGGPPPGMTNKQLKKWRKNQKKMLKNGSLPPDLIPPFGMPFYGAPMSPPPPPQHPNGPMPFRAQSIDDLRAPGLMRPPPFAPYAPPHEGPWIRPAESVIDSGRNASPGDKNKPKKRRAGSLASDRASSSGRGSRRSYGCRDEATHFEEETATAARHLDEQRAPRRPASAMDRPPSADIYETLRQRQTVVATVEMAADDAQPLPSTQAVAENDSDRLPTKVSPEAQVILNRNARLYSQTNAETKDKPLPVAKAKVVKKTSEETPTVCSAPVSKPGSGADGGKKSTSKEEEATTPTEAVVEPEIRAVIGEAMPPLDRGIPRDFEALDAWRSIDVSVEINKRQPRRLQADADESIEDRVPVHLVAAATDPHAAMSEAIYSENLERLPELKKRLIETGAFDVSLGHENNDSASRREAENAVGERKNATTQPAEQNQKASVRRLKQGAALRSKSAEVDRYSESSSREATPQPSRQSTLRGRRAQDPNRLSCGSLSTTSANARPSGEMSDIDFSWVDDFQRRIAVDGTLRSSAGRAPRYVDGGPVRPAVEAPPPSRYELEEARWGRSLAAVEPSMSRRPRSRLDDEPMPAKYFGMSEVENARDSIDYDGNRSNVREKAALFEQEARRVRDEMASRNRQVNVQRPGPRSRSVPRLPVDDGQVYIPSPDYGQAQPVQYRQSRYSYYENGYGEQPYDDTMHQQLSIETTGGAGGAFPSHLIEQLSPSQRRVRRFEGRRETPRYGGGEQVHAADGRLSSYVDGRSSGDGWGAQRGRTYDATEFYRQNILDKRNRELQEKAARKAAGGSSWTSSWGRSKKSKPQPAVAATQPVVETSCGQAMAVNGYGGEAPPYVGYNRSSATYHPVAFNP